MNGSCTTQLDPHGQTPQPVEILNQLAKHPTLMAAAAAARILWDNAPSGGPLFECEHGQNVTLSPPSHISSTISSSTTSFGSTRFQSNHTRRQDGMALHERPEAQSCLVPPPPPMPKLTNKTERQRVHDEVVRQGSEAASSMEESIRVGLSRRLRVYWPLLAKQTFFLFLLYLLLT